MAHAGGWESVRALITVLAAPQPSAQYGDTVCVAGIRIDTNPYCWIRLYPVPYREMGPGFQFHKYDVISVKVTLPKGDSRVESRVLDRESIVIEKNLKPWRPRIPFVQDLATDTMCDMLARVKSDPGAPSLGGVEPRDVSGISFEPHGPWTPEERSKLEGFVAQDALFGAASAPMLEAPRLKAKYKYRCAAVRCNGHEQGILDWELVALQRNLTACTDAELRAAVMAKFYDEICGADRSPVFFVGNQAKRRHVFSVLGVFRPPSADWNRLEFSLGI